MWREILNFFKLKKASVALHTSPSGLPPPACSCFLVLLDWLVTVFLSWPRRVWLLLQYYPGGRFCYVTSVVDFHQHGITIWFIFFFFFFISMNTNKQQGLFSLFDRQHARVDRCIYLLYIITSPGNDSIYIQKKLHANIQNPLGCMIPLDIIRITYEEITHRVESTMRMQPQNERFLEPVWLVACHGSPYHS